MAIDFGVMGLLVAGLSAIGGYVTKTIGSRMLGGVFLPVDQQALTIVILASLIVVTPTALLHLRLVRGGATLGQRAIGLRIARDADRGKLSPSQARAHWVLLYAPLALLIGYPLVSGGAWDPSPFLPLIETPWTPYVAAPALAWYAVLALSMLVSERPLHDRIVGAVVTR